MCCHIHTNTGGIKRLAPDGFDDLNLTYSFEAEHSDPLAGVRRRDVIDGTLGGSADRALDSHDAILLWGLVGFVDRLAGERHVELPGDLADLDLLGHCWSSQTTSRSSSSKSGR